MDTRIIFLEEKCGLFLHRIIPKNYYYFDGAFSQRTVGRAPQKFFQFTTFQNKIRKNYFLFINFNYLKDVKCSLAHRLFSRECFCFSQASIE